MRRRTFLATMGATVGAGSLAGCGVLGGSSFGQAQDPFTQVQSENRGGATVRSGLAIIKKSKFAAVGFQGGVDGNNFDIEVTGQVMQGGPVDVYVMSLGQYNQFKRKPNIIGAEVEQEGTQSPSINKTLDPGRYFLILDNTELGTAKPSGEARVQFSITIGGGGGGTTTTQ